MRQCNDDLRRTKKGSPKSEIYFSLSASGGANRILSYSSLHDNVQGRHPFPYIKFVRIFIRTVNTRIVTWSSMPNSLITRMLTSGGKDSRPEMMLESHVLRVLGRRVRSPLNSILEDVQSKKSHWQVTVHEEQGYQLIMVKCF